VGANNLTSDLV